MVEEVFPLSFRLLVLLKGFTARGGRGTPNILKVGFQNKLAILGEGGDPSYEEPQSKGIKGELLGEKSYSVSHVEVY